MEDYLDWNHVLSFFTVIMISITLMFLCVYTNDTGAKNHCVSVAQFQNVSWHDDGFWPGGTCR